MTKRLKIAFVLWGIAVLSLFGAISSGRVPQIIPGVLILVLIGGYFYITKNKIVAKKQPLQTAEVGYSFNNLPTNEPDDIEIERTIEVEPVDNIQSLLIRFRGSEKWGGYTLKEAKQEILEGGEDFLFEYEPWVISAIIPLPKDVKFKDRDNEDFLSDYEEFEVYVEPDRNISKYLLGTTNSLYSDDIKEILKKDGVVPVRVDVFGGKCMYRCSITKDIDINESEYQFVFSI